MPGVWSGGEGDVDVLEADGVEKGGVGGDVDVEAGLGHFVFTRV